MMPEVFIVLGLVVLLIVGIVAYKMFFTEDDPTPDKSDERQGALAATASTVEESEEENEERETVTEAETR